MEILEYRDAFVGVGGDEVGAVGFAESTDAQAV
jgi:hypothetical protein